MTKSGVAVEGKAAAEPANGKANGQVSAPHTSRAASTRSHGWHRRLAGWRRSGGGGAEGSGTAEARHRVFQ